MINISFKQYLMLKKINRAQQFPASDLNQKEIKIIEFLISRKLVAPIKHDEYVDLQIDRVMPWINTIVDGYEITQEGLAQIHSFTETHLGRWIPIIISIIALVISILALKK